MAIKLAAMSQASGTLSAKAPLLAMAVYFFDFRANGALSFDEEGTELPDADMAHAQAVGALADLVRDAALECSTEQSFAIRVRDSIGPVLDVSAVVSSRIVRKN